jgi:glycosyltransferase involved in cell wall biosynthesis
MKIGFVTGEYPPMQGGVGAFTQELAKALAEQGHEIHIMTRRGVIPPGLTEKSRKPGEPFQLPFAQLYPFINRWRWPSMAKIADWTVRHEFDVVNIQYQPAAYNMRSPAIHLLPWRLKEVTTTVVTFHDLRVPYLFPKAGRLRDTAVTFMARQATGVIVTNAADYQSLTARVCLPIEQIPIGSNIIAREVTPAEVTAARRQLGLNNNDCLLGYFGFLHESKGADTLLQALAKLPDHVHVVFIGGRTGSSDEANNQLFYEQLDAFIKQHNLSKRVHWTGFVSDYEASAYLTAVDLMVLAYRDGASLRRGTLMAALAHGRVLLTTLPTTPTPELVHGQNVWLAPPDNPAALAAAIQHLLADADLRQRLGQEATAVANLFTWDKIAARTAGFFQQLRSSH